MPEDLQRVGPVERAHPPARAGSVKEELAQQEDVEGAAEECTARSAAENVLTQPRVLNSM